MKINKAATADTASLLFQTDYTTIAEIGLISDDYLAVKLSDDGVKFKTVQYFTPSGSAQFPSGRDIDLYVKPIDASGALSSTMGPPNSITVSTGRENMSWPSRQVFFFPFFIDRPTQINGAAAAQHIAASPGSILRAGIYKAGEPLNNSWVPGQKHAEYDVLPADIAGEKVIVLGAPVTLERGWYVQAVGCNGSGAAFRAVNWCTPGLYNYQFYSSDTSIDFRTSGMTRYLYDPAQTDLILNGFPQTLPNAVSDIVSVSPLTLQALIPLWTAWE